MRKKHSFLLTILPSEEQKPALRGRLQFISTGSTFTFTSLEELQQLIENQIQSQEINETFTGSVHETRSSYHSINPQHWDEEI